MQSETSQAQRKLIIIKANSSFVSLSPPLERFWAAGLTTLKSNAIIYDPPAGKPFIKMYTRVAGDVGEVEQKIKTKKRNK